MTEFIQNNCVPVIACDTGGENMHSILVAYLTVLNFGTGQSGHPRVSSLNPS